MQPPRTKIGISVTSDVDVILDALSFSQGKTRSEIVERAVEQAAARLTSREREKFEAARSVRLKG